MHVRNIYNQILLKTFLSSPNLRKNTGLVFLTLLYNIHSHKNRKLLSISCDYMQYTISSITRGGSRTAETSKMERFLIMVNGWKPLNFITKRSILDVAAALDPPLVGCFKCAWIGLSQWFYFCVNPISANVGLIETSQLICCANQLIGFYMRATLPLNGLMAGRRLITGW